MSVLDGAVLLAGAIDIYLLGLDHFFAWIIAFVVGHFFLFCNVFRITRPSELLWAAGFILLCGLNIVTGNPDWPWVFSISFVTTILLLTKDLRRPDYHGIAWQWINPNLPNWWATNVGKTNVSL